MVPTRGRVFKIRWSFKMRTLLLLVAAIGIVCSWEANTLRQRARAVALLRGCGAFLRVESAPLSWLPERIRGPLSPWLDRYSDVTVELEFNSHSRGEPTRAERDGIIAAIATLNELWAVYVSFRIDDDNVRTLASMSDLEVLGFNTRGITDVAVGHLQKLRRLDPLSIYGGITDQMPTETIIKLNSLPRLYSLGLHGAFSREDAARLRTAFPRLKHLALYPAVD